MFRQIYTHEIFSKCFIVVNFIWKVFSLYRAAQNSLNVTLYCWDLSIVLYSQIVHAFFSHWGHIYMQWNAKFQQEKCVQSEQQWWLLKIVDVHAINFPSRYRTALLVLGSFFTCWMHSSLYAHWCDLRHNGFLELSVREFPMSEIIQFVLFQWAFPSLNDYPYL